MKRRGVWCKRVFSCGHVYSQRLLLLCCSIIDMSFGLSSSKNDIEEIMEALHTRFWREIDHSLKELTFKKRERVLNLLNFFFFSLILKQPSPFQAIDINTTLTVTNPSLFFFLFHYQFHFTFIILIIFLFIFNSKMLSSCWFFFFFKLLLSFDSLSHIEFSN